MYAPACGAKHHRPVLCSPRLLWIHLQAGYKDDLTKEEAMELVARAIRCAHMPIRSNTDGAGACGGHAAAGGSAWLGCSAGLLVPLQAWQPVHAWRRAHLAAAGLCCCAGLACLMTLGRAATWTCV